MKNYRIESKPKKVDQGSLLQQLNWYQVNSDTLESKSFLYDYMVENGNSTVVEKLKKLDYPFHPTDGFIARLLSIGTEIPKNSLESFESSLVKYIKYGVDKVEVEVGTGIQDNSSVAQKRSFYENVIPELGEVEIELDRFFVNGFESDFSMISWLHKTETRYKDATIYADCYRPLSYELQHAVDGEEFHLESYKYMTKPQMRKCLKFVNALIKDCETYLDVDGKVMKKKVKTPEQLVEKLTYMTATDDGAYKSIKATKIIGADELWTYDTKLRFLTQYVAINSDGLTVIGSSSIRNYDAEKSCKKKVYPTKVDDVLNRILVSTKKGSSMVIDEMKVKGRGSKGFPSTGRINTNTILLKIYNKGDE